MNETYSLKLEKLSSKLELTERAIYESQLFKELEQQLLQTHEEFSTKLADRRILIDRIEVMKRDKAAKDAIEEKLKNENYRLSRETEDLRSQMGENLKRHTEEIMKIKAENVENLKKN